MTGVPTSSAALVELRSEPVPVSAIRRPSTDARGGRSLVQSMSETADLCHQEVAGLPRAIAEAQLQIGNIVLTVHHLDNGQRVIDAASMHAFMAALEDGSLMLTEEDSMALAKAVMS